jgi:hypothetical protein|tara:strand:- start:516 stop:752 length:237 start_codon:yes stop_codon:yes gene_type:complete
MVESGSIVFTQAQFDSLLVKMELCVRKDSLIAVQDSIILEYQHLDDLNPPFWKQMWFKNLMSAIGGIVIKEAIENNVK